MPDNNYGSGPYGGGSLVEPTTITPDPGMDPSAPQPDPTVHLVDRQYISQFAQDTVGINVYVTGTLQDPDSQIVNVAMSDINGNVVFFQPAVWVSTGNYQLTFTSEQTSLPGFYTLTWSFSINAQPQAIDTFIEIGATNPAYDNLPTQMQQLVEQTWIRFADMFDSPQGGPHLQTFFQANFSRGRLAQLLQLALNSVNLAGQPYTNWSTTNFPMAVWGGLLEKALYIEVLKHLIRSYIEQPMPNGITVARMDRRDYTDRWQTMLNLEMADYKGMIDNFRISQMFLSRPRVLVSGGAFGNWGPTRLPGAAAARGVSRIWGAYF